MRIGGCINNKSNKEKEALESFGRNLGICFQITDDILDYSSKEKIFGKKIGNDFIEGKLTLPIILLFQKLIGKEKDKLTNLFLKKERTEEEFNFILENLKKYKILEDCKKRADYFSNVSSDSLNMFANNSLVKKLQELSKFIVNRTN